MAAPPKPDGQSCSTIGQRGFRVLVWDNAENNQFVPAGSPHHVHDINQASFIKAGFSFHSKTYQSGVSVRTSYRYDLVLVRSRTFEIFIELGLDWN